MPKLTQSTSHTTYELVIYAINGTKTTLPCLKLSQARTKRVAFKGHPDVKKTQIYRVFRSQVRPHELR
jgi:hypothetical protein